MKVLGITGGIGSGKSEVLKYLEETYDAFVCPLDNVARLLQKSGQECFDRIVERFGKDILGSDGELDRERLGAVVFSNLEKLAVLNGIVHPGVKLWVRQDILQKEKEGTRLYVLESALFPDVEYRDICEEMWYIYAKEPIRRQRLKEFRHYTEEKIQRILKSQPSEQAFRNISTAVIENSGAFEDTMKQIGELL
ncbi:MAG: dephospho-CoA kinase [Ruminococcus sp.]|nr:dephospho-CoA kinase [Ruminococcus sp.]